MSFRLPCTVDLCLQKHPDYVPVNPAQGCTCSTADRSPLGALLPMALALLALTVRRRRRA